jgi:hypothetical protein
MKNSCPEAHMGARHISRAVIAAALAGACAVAAIAQTTPPAPSAPVNISGHWEFRTAPFKGSCVISGEIEFRKLPGPLGYVCSFTSRESCDNRPDLNYIDVKQSCTVSERDGNFSIISKVEEILDYKPEDMQVGYEADNFFVRPGGNGELVGMFKSLSQATVKFWRERIS